MRVFAALGAATVGIAAVAPLPNFTFRQIQAGAVVSDETFKHCKRMGEEMQCEGSDVVAGVRAYFIITYFQNRLSSLSFFAGRKDYGVVSASLLSRYGEPCSKHLEKVQNHLGVTFDTEVTVWCFATGKLTLSEIGGDLSHTSAMYFDDNRAPARARVDF